MWMVQSRLSCDDWWGFSWLTDLDDICSAVRSCSSWTLMKSFRTLSTQLSGFEHLSPTGLKICFLTLLYYFLWTLLPQWYNFPPLLQWSHFLVCFFTPGLLNYIFANMHTFSSGPFSDPATQATLPNRFEALLEIWLAGQPASGESPEWVLGLNCCMSCRRLCCCTVTLAKSWLLLLSVDSKISPEIPAFSEVLTSPRVPLSVRHCCKCWQVRETNVCLNFHSVCKIWRFVCVCLVRDIKQKDMWGWPHCN